MTSFANEFPNSDALRSAQAGTEVYAGTAVTPTFKLYGDLQLTGKRRLSSSPDRNGTFFRNITPRRGPIECDGTYSQELTFEDFAILPRYHVNVGATPTSDSESTPGYTNTYRPHARRTRLDLMTVEHGFPGMVERATGVYFPEVTISGDIDDADGAWKWSSPVKALTNDLKANTLSDAATSGSTSTVVKSAAGWTPNAYQGLFVTMTSGNAEGETREIASNDATTLTVVGLFTAAVANTDTFVIHAAFTSLNDRTREAIPCPGTQLFIDDGSASIGTTQILGEFISFSVTSQSAMGYKRLMENVDTYAARLDQGWKVITGQVRLEHSNRREVDKYNDMEPRAIRIYQEGSVIDSGAGTNKHAQIDIYAGYWEDMTPDTRSNNLTRTYAFIGFQDDTETVPFEWEAKHTMSTLP